MAAETINFTGYLAYFAPFLSLLLLGCEAVSNDDFQSCGKNMTSLDILPGGGWDNLRNVEMSPVLSQNYSYCRTTADGKYLIPDNVVVTPVRQGHLDVTADAFSHWSSFTSLTASSINLDAMASFTPYGAISGSYTHGYQETKRRQISESSMSVRVQARHTIHNVQALPDSQLHPTFKSRLLEIAAHLQARDQKTSEYLFQKLIRDYGTHFVTGIKSGAALVQEDYVKQSYAGTDDGISELSGITAAASGTFFKFIGVNISVGYHTNSSKSDIHGYLSNRTSSKIYSVGGPPVLPNFTLDDWQTKLEKNLVAVDRSGDPLYYAITANTLPDVPVATLNDIIVGVQGAIRQYYVRNSHIGCMDPTSDMFDRQANIGEINCKGGNRNFTFGGVYQTCQGGDVDACKAYTQSHPKTKDFSCPEGYQAVEFWHGTKHTCRRVCEEWLVFFEQCHDDCFSKKSVMQVTSYWCAPSASAAPKSGYLFGGLYTSDTVNPVTGLKGCPEYFYPLDAGFDLSVCVSDDFELGATMAIPFAGFFSCEYGNPLVFQHKDATSTPTRGLVGHVQQLGAARWPKQCPFGYSQHLADISQGCEIMYCVKAYALRRDISPPVRRPPYTNPPPQVNNATLMILTPAKKILYKDRHQPVWHETAAADAEKLLRHEPLQQASPQITPTPSRAWTPGEAAGLSVGLALMVGIIVALIVFGHRRRNKKTDDLLSEKVRHYRKGHDNSTVSDDPSDHT